ncbi:MAG: hypothetical protein AB7F66_03060 [Bacteriovoracia bacterium]
MDKTGISNLILSENLPGGSGSMQSLLQTEAIPSSSHATGLQTELGKWLESSANPAAPPVQSALTLNSSPPTGGAINPRVALLAPVLLDLTRQIVDELGRNLNGLLSLNPSRREALLRHLCMLGGIAGAKNTPKEVLESLRAFLHGGRTPQHSVALAAYLEEVALVFLGQTLLLKAWSDRNIRAWAPTDLTNVNWTLSFALKPFVPHQRDGWQLTKPNLYSWFNPSPQLQSLIWQTLQGLDLSDEAPTLMTDLLKGCQQIRSQLPESHGYDSRFFSAVWGASGRLTPEVRQRHQFGFSPTLREGSLARSGESGLGENFQWIGSELNPFLFLLGELTALWSGPACPRFWHLSSGLELHPREQLSLSMPLSPLNGPKSSPLVQYLSEMEACRIAFVMEDYAIRSTGRTGESAWFRGELAGFPFFKGLKAQETTLGDLQACVALSKLRPGGLMWWTREEPITALEGPETLKFLLDRGKLLAQWDFTGIAHSLPLQRSLFPKYLYLFERCASLEARNTHRPRMVRLQGQIRSHVEVPLFLQDAIQEALAASPGAETEGRGHWQVQVRVSNTTQQEWAERWPEKTSEEIYRKFDQLKENSTPLGQIAGIRLNRRGADAPWMTNQLQADSLQVRGAVLQMGSEQENGKRRIVTAITAQQLGSTPASDLPLTIIPHQPELTVVLRAYLESPAVAEWLELFCERKKGAWELSEASLKFLPVPNALLASLRENRGASAALPLDVNTVDQLAARKHDIQFRSAVFVAAAHELERARADAARLADFVDANGSIHWKVLLRILPKSECIAFPLHPDVRFSGSLPPHVPIHRIDRVKSKPPALLLATQSGLHLSLSCTQPLFLDMLWSQFQGLSYPTWNELAQNAVVPRRTEVAQTAAADILRRHGETERRRQLLTDILHACPLV